MAFSPDDSVVAFGDGFGILREWEWRLDQVRLELDTQQSQMFDIAYARGGKSLATAARDGSLCLWKLAQSRSAGVVAVNGAVVPETDPHRLRISFQRLLAGTEVFALQARPYGLVNDSLGPRVDLRILGENQAPDTPFPIQCLTHLFADDAPRLVINQLNQVHCMTMTPDRRVLLIGDHSPPFAIRLWDLDSGTSLATLDGHRGAVTSLACSPTSGTLASASSDDTVRLWDLRSKTLLATLEGHHAGVSCVAFSRDGGQLASAGSDCQVRFWNPATGEALPLLLNHRTHVRSVAYCPDEPLLATGDDDGYVHLWALPSGEELLVLGRLQGKANVLVFSPQGDALAAGSCNPDNLLESLQIWQAPR